MTDNDLHKKTVVCRIVGDLEKAGQVWLVGSSKTNRLKFEVQRRSNIQIKEFSAKVSLSNFAKYKRSLTGFRGLAKRPPSEQSGGNSRLPYTGI